MIKETKWSVDQAHSEITFKVRHLMISNVKGSFKQFDASIYTSGKDFTTAEIELFIDTASIDTGDEKRDAHLRGTEFFDVEKHKQISFITNTIGKADAEGHHELWGDLTMLGITKKIMLTVEFGGIVKDPWGNEKAGFTIQGKINRSDWGLVWNITLETGGFMVSDVVTISCEIELLNLGDRGLILELDADKTASA